MKEIHFLPFSMENLVWNVENARIFGVYIYFIQGLQILVFSIGNVVGFSNFVCFDVRPIILIFSHWNEFEIHNCKHLMQGIHFCSFLIEMLVNLLFVCIWYKNISFAVFYWKCQRILGLCVFHRRTSKFECLPFERWHSFYVHYK